MSEPFRDRARTLNITASASPDTVCVPNRYAYIPALGGLRGHCGTPRRSVNAFWENQSFHNYADYAMTDAFRSGLAELRDLGHALRCAVMCAEAVWWRCHRRIIADYLIAAGETVFHILRAGHIEPARPQARPGPDRGKRLSIQPRSRELGRTSSRSSLYSVKMPPIAGWAQRQLRYACTRRIIGTGVVSKWRTHALWCFAIAGGTFPAGGHHCVIDIYDRDIRAIARKVAVRSPDHSLTRAPVTSATFRAISMFVSYLSTVERVRISPIQAGAGFSPGCRRASAYLRDCAAVLPAKGEHGLEAPCAAAPIAAAA